MKFKTAYRILAEHQKWLRGEGKYAWSGNPAKRAEMPYTPEKLDVAIDTALNALALLCAEVEYMA